MKEHKIYSIGKLISYVIYSPIALFRGLVDGWKEADIMSKERFITD